MAGLLPKGRTMIPLGDECTHCHLTEAECARRFPCCGLCTHDFGTETESAKRKKKKKRRPRNSTPIRRGRVRKSQLDLSGYLYFGLLSFDFDTRVLRRGEKEIVVTGLQRDILGFLFLHAPESVDWRTISAAIKTSEKSIRNMVSYLNNRLYCVNTYPEGLALTSVVKPMHADHRKCPKEAKIGMLNEKHARQNAYRIANQEEIRQLQQEAETA